MPKSGLHPLLREKVIPAEINFRSKEEWGDWHGWRAATADATPPWWDAGADYIWEALLAFVDGFTQHTWAVDFPKVVNDELIALAEDVFEKKLKPYESNFKSSRRDEFVSFVRKRLASQLAALSRERWEKTATDAPRQDETGCENDASAPQDVSACTRRRSEFVMSKLKKKGWSISEWADKSDVDHKTAANYLNGKNRPYPGTRKKLADALDIKPEDLPD